MKNCMGIFYFLNPIFYTLNVYIMNSQNWCVVWAELNESKKCVENDTLFR